MPLLAQIDHAAIAQCTQVRTGRGIDESETGDGDGGTYGRGASPAETERHKEHRRRLRRRAVIKEKARHFATITVSRGKAV